MGSSSGADRGPGGGSPDTIEFLQWAADAVASAGVLMTMVPWHASSGSAHQARAMRFIVALVDQADGEGRGCGFDALTMPTLSATTLTRMSGLRPFMWKMTWPSFIPDHTQNMPGGHKRK
jgi:hypothetical protein